MLSNRRCGIYSIDLYWLICSDLVYDVRALELKIKELPVGTVGGTTNFKPTQKEEDPLITNRDWFQKEVSVLKSPKFTLKSTFIAAHCSTLKL